MDAIIDERFKRVERALANLITSISTYNPAPALATDLVTADLDLNSGLEQLSTHQSNYTRILNLRATTLSLDAQIRTSLTLLAKTRSELLSTAATTYPTHTNPVSYSELLSYARRISKFTLPPTYREPKPTAPEQADGSETPLEAKSAVQTNGTTTPTAVTNGVPLQTQTQTPLPVSSAMEIDSVPVVPVSEGTQPQAQSLNSTVRENTEKWSTWLNASSETPFFPWPSEGDIRRGALASIQILVDQGVDPATFDPERSAELEAERKRIEEEAEVAEEERRREVQRRVSVSVGIGAERPRVTEETKVFQLETFDDDEDDD